MSLCFIKEVAAAMASHLCVLLLVSLWWVSVDNIQGSGASFSLEIPPGLRFLAVSRLFTDEELKKLPAIG